MINSLEDLQPILKKFNRYFRKKVSKKFEQGGPGWPPIKGETEARRPTENAVKQMALELVRKKLNRDVKRAKKRLQSGKSLTKTKTTSVTVGGTTFKRTETTSDSIERRYTVLKEFERLAAGGSAEFSLTGDARTDKSIRGLMQRTERAELKAASRPLGRIASSIKSKLTKYDVTIESSIPWAGVHNKGGTAGHGAKIPARTFLELDDEDLTMLAKIVEDHVAEAVSGG